MHAKGVDEAVLPIPLVGYSIYDGTQYQTPCALVFFPSTTTSGVSVAGSVDAAVGEEGGVAI